MANKDSTIGVPKINNLHWRYPAFVGEMNLWAPKRVDLEIERGEFFRSTGPSGPGKTTICKAIVGLIPHATRVPANRVNEHLQASVEVMGSLACGVDAEANVVHGVARGKLLGEPARPPLPSMLFTKE